MTVPTDLAAMFSLRTHNRIRAITPEHPNETTVQALKPTGGDLHVYPVKFFHLGQNMLKVEYGHGQYLVLEFFVTQPLATLIKKRAQFLVSHGQWQDPKLLYRRL